MSVPTAERDDRSRPAIRAFGQCLLLLSVANALNGVLRLVYADSESGLMAATECAGVAVAVLGAAGAAWSLARPERITLAVWWVTAAVITSSILAMVWWDPSSFWKLSRAMTVAVILVHVAYPLSWTLFAWQTLRALVGGARPVVSVAAQTRAAPVAETHLSYQPGGHRHVAPPVTRALATFLLLNSGFPLLIWLAVMLAFGAGMALSADTFRPAWLLGHGLNLARASVIPTVLVVAAIALLLFHPRRRYLASAVALSLAVDLAVVVRDVLVDKFPINAHLFSAVGLLGSVNLTVFVLRALRHRW